MSIARAIKNLPERFMRDFRSCERGAVAIIVALAIIPFMVAAGLAVDLSRAYLTKARLSHALDAAGLAVGSMRTTSSDSVYLDSQFNVFFTANYPDEAEGFTHWELSDNETPLCHECATERHGDRPWPLEYYA